MRLTKKQIASHALTFAGALVPVSQTLAAPNLDITLGADVEYHDNAALSSTNEKSDIERVARAQVDYVRPDGPLTANVNYLVERHDFQDDVEEDRTVVSGAAQAKWEAIPKTLNFTGSHQVSDELRDRRDANVNSNMERRSVTTLGAEGILHFSRRDSVVLGPRVSNVDVSGSGGSNSDRAALDVAWHHLLSPVSSLVLTGSEERVSADKSVDEYDASRAMLTYQTKLAHLTYQIGGGFNRIDRNVGDSVDGYSVLLSADYQAEGMTVGASLVRQLTDSEVGLSGYELSLPSFRAQDGN
ncbi:conserved hypothetical protein, partial [Ricinus communis]